MSVFDGRWKARCDQGLRGTVFSVEGSVCSSGLGTAEFMCMDDGRCFTELRGVRWQGVLSEDWSCIRWEHNEVWERTEEQADTCQPAPEEVAPAVSAPEPAEREAPAEPAPPVAEPVQRWLPIVVQGVRVVSHAEEPGLFLVDNSMLQAVSEGLGFRTSPRLEDLSPGGGDESFLPWGSRVRGVVDGDWLRVTQVVPNEAQQVAFPSEEETCCAVCFEELAEVGGAVSVPCTCQALYCRPCWDRALNSKFHQTKQAQCPTCRTPMRVDFDADTGWLRFERLPEGQDDPDMRQRLQDQTKPFQVKLLEKHGRFLRTTGCGLDAMEHGPQCVCGEKLVFQTVRERVFGFVAECLQKTKEDARQDPRVKELTQRFLNGYHEVPITCDICETLTGQRRLDAEGNVWTCEGGNLTLLHGQSYDVCENCYDQHVLGRAPSPPRTRSPQRPRGRTAS